MRRSVATSVPLALIVTLSQVSVSLAQPSPGSAAQQAERRGDQTLVRQAPGNEFRHPANGPNNPAENLFRRRSAVNGPQGQNLGYWFEPRRGLGFAWIDPASRNSGMTLGPADPALRAHLKLPEDEGLIVTALAPGSPAAAAGIHQNDLLTRIYSDPDKPIKLSRPEDLEAALKKTAAEPSPVFLQLLRNGTKCTLGIQPRISVSLGPVEPKPPAYWIGVGVAPVEPALRAQLQLPGKQGLIVLDVVKDGPAARAGLQVHDILLKLDGADLTDQAGLSQFVQSRGEKSVALELLREGRKREVNITPERRKSATVSYQPSELRTGQFDVVLPGAVVSGQQDPNANVVGLLGNFDALDTSEQLLLNAVELNRTNQAENPTPSRDSTDKRLDELSAQIKELRQAVEAMARAQANK